jgi:hypothetical protein
MAITITARGSYGAATNIGNGGTFATGSFTPSADSLLLAFIGTQGGPGTASNGIASLSGHGTWAELTVGDGPDVSGNDQMLEVWWVKPGSSPGASAVTATNTTQTKIRAAMSVFEVSGVDAAAAIGDIIRQCVEVNQGTAGLSGSVTLSAFGDATENAVVIGVVCNRFNETIAWDSPLNGIHRLVTGTEAMELATAQDVGEDTSPGFSWGANNRTWRAMALEVVADVGGTDGNASPGVVGLAVAAPGPTATGSGQGSPAVIVGAATLPAPTATGSGQASPGVLPLSVVVPPPTASVSGDGTGSPSAIGAVLTLLAPSVSGAGVATPGAIARALSVPQPTASGSGDGTATPPTVALAASILSVTATGAGNASPAVIARALGLPAPTAAGPATGSPSALTVAALVRAATAAGTAVASPGVITITLTVPSPTGGEITVEITARVVGQFWRNTAGNLHMIPLGTGLRWGLRGDEKASDPFLYNNGTKDEIMGQMDGVWAVHSGSDIADLKAAINAALDSIGYRGVDGERLI